MSSESGSDSDKKWSHQFGLYRSRVDAKTEEFLGMSRERQMRRGCACAALASALTVLLVVIIIVTYEYSIAAHSMAVQKRTRNLNSTQTGDDPVADKLNWKRINIDQAAFERMPLLINALQENSFVEPSAEQHFTSSGSNQQGRSLNIWNPARKSTPRPFIFEYRSPTPSPFMKSTQSSTKSWLDNYRSTQRLKNLEHVINYLQKKVHAKVADLIPSSSNRLVTFSGAFVHPTEHNPEPLSTTSASLDQQQAASSVVVSGQPFKADLLYKYKPDSPGDINMLADHAVRFSPFPMHEIEPTLIPLFKPIKYPPRNICYGIKCPTNTFLSKFSSQSSIFDEKQTTLKPSRDKSNLLSLMLDIFPFENEQKAASRHHKVTQFFPLKRPDFKLHSKPATTVNHNYYKPRPTFIPVSMKPHFRIYNGGRKRMMKANSNGNQQHEQTSPPPSLVVSSSTAANVLPVNLNPSIEDVINTLYQTHYPITTHSPPPYMFNISNHHVGAVHKVFELSTETPAPPSRNQMWSTTTPEILKFSHEDAKVPDILRSIRRSSYHEPITERQPITIKLRNELAPSTTTIIPLEAMTSEPSITTTPSSLSTTFTLPTSSSTTEKSLPQINGHYRSLNQNSKNINEWLSVSDLHSESPVTSTASHITTALNLAPLANVTRPSYVDINRNHTSRHFHEFGKRLNITRTK